MAKYKLNSNNGNVKIKLSAPGALTISGAIGRYITSETDGEIEKLPESGASVAILEVEPSLDTMYSVKITVPKKIGIPESQFKLKRIISQNGEELDSEETDNPKTELLSGPDGNGDYYYKEHIKFSI